MYNFPQDLCVSKLFIVCTGNEECTVVKLLDPDVFVDSHFVKLVSLTFKLERNYWTTEHDRAVDIVTAKCRNGQD